MPLSLADELKWLKANPAFEERPATVSEFLSADYLNIEKGVRRSIRSCLVDIMGDDIDGTRMTRYPLAMITGGIGIGKTTIASIVLPWLAHWVLCLKDPQDFFDLLPGSRIAFMQMSTSESQAKEVVFGDIKARIQHSAWFRDKFPYDTAFKNQIRFPKDIWILPGDSAETTFEGYNILGGILDEADSHKVTQEKDYAETGFDTIHARVSSRFQDRGFLLVIGQMKKAVGFAAKKFAEIKRDPNAYGVHMTIWESLGWERWTNPDGTRDSFFYDKHRKLIVPSGAAKLVTNEHIIEIPTVYRKDFENNPEKALRDLAGYPPVVGDPFISLVHKIEAARDRWIEHHDGYETPVDEHGRFAPWFRALDTLKRCAHLDIAYSANGDALGLSMGHVRELVEIDGETKPYIVIDFMLRMKAPAGGEIFLADVRRIIYDLRDEMGFRLNKVTMDGFQSTDTRQQLYKRRFESEEVSVDRQILPYHDLREAIYEDRIEFPKYMVYLNRGDTDKVEIALHELSQLVDEGKKIDHPVDGSKDVADTLAGVTYTLMGDRRYRRKVVSINTTTAGRQQRLATGTDGMHPAISAWGLQAPIPPQGGQPTWEPRR